jgi:hypothetical protein
MHGKKYLFCNNLFILLYKYDMCIHILFIETPNGSSYRGEERFSGLSYRLQYRPGVFFRPD